MKTHYHDELAAMETTHWWCLGRLRILTSLLAQSLPRPLPHDVPAILDIGCGAAGAMLSVLETFGRAVGLEYFDTAASYCATHGGHQVVRGSAEALPFQAGQFSVVTMFDVLEHLENDHAVVRGIFPLLKPGGRLCIAVPAHPWMWGNQDIISEHKRRYTRRALETLLREAGYVLQRVTYFNTFLFPPIAAIRVLRRWMTSATITAHVSSDFGSVPPAWINMPLKQLFGSEAGWLRHANLPFGVSLFVVASRP